MLRIGVPQQRPNPCLVKLLPITKANGQAKALAAFNDPKGNFVSKDLYIFALDMSGKIIAHGVNAALIGKI